MEIVRSSNRLNNNTLDETKDFISELPDAILVHILSFLPTEDAIKTVLLRRFGNLWRSVPVLDLDGFRFHQWEDYYRGSEGYDCRKVIDIIHHVSNLHDVGVLAKLRLKVPFPFRYSRRFYDHNYKKWEKATAGHIEKLVSYAIKRHVKVLHLSFRCCMTVHHSDFYVLLDDVFRSNYLKDLRLTACDIKSWREISLKALRVLLLHRVSLSDQAIENILLGCPLLEDLSLSYCYGLRKLHCESPNLKKLRLTSRTSQEKLCLSCPHVRSLEIAGCIERVKLLDVSSLIDASISFSHFKSELRPYNKVERLLQKVSQCKTSTSCTNTILMLTIWNFRNVPCASYRWKNLTTKLYLTKWHYPGLSWLFKSSPLLETLAMYIYPGSDSFYKLEVSNWISAYDFEGESYWDLQEARFPCLKCIIIHCYTTEPYVIQMLKFLLKNATKLQKMVISIKGTFEATWSDTEKKNDQITSEKLPEFVKELSTFPRASSRAMICVL